MSDLTYQEEEISREWRKFMQDVQQLVPADVLKFWVLKLHIEQAEKMNKSTYEQVDYLLKHMSEAEFKERFFPKEKR